MGDIQNMHTPYDNSPNLLAIVTLVLGVITHWTANGVAAFFTVCAGATAAIYNGIKIYEFFDKKKLKDK